MPFQDTRSEFKGKIAKKTADVGKGGWKRSNMVCTGPRSYVVLCFFLSRCYLADCIRHTMLDPLTDSRYCEEIDTLHNDATFWTFLCLKRLRSAGYTVRLDDSTVPQKVTGRRFGGGRSVGQARCRQAVANRKAVVNLVQIRNQNATSVTRECWRKKMGGHCPKTAESHTRRRQLRLHARKQTHQTQDE
jgi:hypothetical protein